MKGTITVDLGDELYKKLEEYQAKNYGISRAVVIRQALAAFFWAKNMNTIIISPPPGTEMPNLERTS